MQPNQNQPPTPPPVTPQPQPVQPGPYQTIPPPQPRKGIPTWLIVGGVTALVATIGVFIILAIVIIGAISNAPSNKKGQAPITDASVAKKATYSNDWITFEYPENYKKDKGENRTIVTSDGTVQDKVTLTRPGADLMISYRHLTKDAKPPIHEVSLATRLAAAEKAVAAYDDAKPEKILAIVSEDGYGCSVEPTMLRGAELIHRDELVGVAIQYECSSFEDPNLLVATRRAVFYDKTGSKHILVVSMAENLLETHAKEFTGPADSFTLK